MPKVLRAQLGRATISSCVMRGTPKRRCASSIAACPKSNSAYTGGIACDSRDHPMCPASMPMAAAFSASVLPVGPDP